VVKFSLRVGEARVRFPVEPNLFSLPGEWTRFCLGCSSSRVQVWIAGTFEETKLTLTKDIHRMRQLRSRLCLIEWNKLLTSSLCAQMAAAMLLATFAEPFLQEIASPMKRCSNTIQTEAFCASTLFSSVLIFSNKVWPRPCSPNTSREYAPTIQWFTRSLCCARSRTLDSTKELALSCRVSLQCNMERFYGMI
jgi:hypothetical protein